MPLVSDTAEARPKRAWRLLCLAGAAMLLTWSPVWADPIDPMLSGTTSYDGWNDLTGVNYPGYPFFPGTPAWPAPIVANQPGSGDADMDKVAGNGYPSGASIYFGGLQSGVNLYGGTLEIGDATPLAGLENVVFQVQIGESTGFDFFDGVFPVLHYNGGAQALPADFIVILDRFQNGTFTDPDTGEELPIFLNTWLLQWDVSALGAISDFRVELSGVMHSQLYQAQIDQSDQFGAVPEPGAGLLLASGLGGLIALDRRRKRRLGTPA